MKRINLVENNKMVRAFSEGKSLDEISKQFGRTKTTIAKYISQVFDIRATRKELPRETEYTIIRLHVTGVKTKLIAEQVDLAIPKVRDVIDKVFGVIKQKQDE